MTPRSATSTGGRPLRRDAERNRQQILLAARAAFAERGLEVTLDEIAQRAGVGVGTVYRRYANKDDLIDELYEDVDQFALRNLNTSSSDVGATICSNAETWMCPGRHAGFCVHAAFDLRTLWLVRWIERAGAATGRSAAAPRRVRSFRTRAMIPAAPSPAKPGRPPRPSSWRIMSA
jgi:AcrR family transcriptional regulator